MPPPSNSKLIGFQIASDGVVLMIVVSNPTLMQRDGKEQHAFTILLFFFLLLLITTPYIAASLEIDYCWLVYARRRVIAGPGRVHAGFVIQMTTRRHVAFGHVVL